MDSTKISTHDEQVTVVRGSGLSNDIIAAQKARDEAKKAEAKPHTMPLVVTVGGKAIYTRDNY